MPFFMLECWESESVEHVTLRDIPHFEDFSWISGSLMPTDVLPSPLRLTITGEPGDVIPPLLDEGILIIRHDVIKTLVNLGVDNLQLFDVEIVDDRNGTVMGGFSAVNIIGAVAAADLGASDHRAHGRHVIDVDFDSLAIDEAKTQGLLMFRLAECVPGIVIDERLKEPLERIGGLSLVNPGEWIG